MNNIFQIFGSADSQDLDVAVFVDAIPSIKESSLLCSQYSEELGTFLKTDKELNTNIAVLGDGELLDVYKGTTDELNNALLATYSLHEQIHPLQIKRKLRRDVDLKMLRCARKLLSFFSRTEHRVRIKEALRGGFETKIEVLKTIQADQYTDFGKKGSLVDFRKTAAFQLGITLALIMGEELYTKADVILFYPKMKGLIQREENADTDGLLDCWDAFISISERRLGLMKHLKDLREYRYKKP